MLILGLDNPLIVFSTVGRQTLGIDMVNIAVLRGTGVLAHRPSKPLLWTPRGDFYHSNSVVPCLHLARRDKLMAPSLRVSFTLLL